MSSNALLLCVLLQHYVLCKGHPSPCSARDCLDIQDRGFTTSGVYQISPGRMSSVHDVYCDLTTDKGGWLVFQRRMDGSETFDRTWDEYVVGFGNVSGEHWLGNQILKSILLQGSYELQIKIVTYRKYTPLDEPYTTTVNYNIFDIGDYAHNYRISVGVAKGFAAEAMLYHDGAEFSTRDRENNPSNCSSIHTGGWWFKDCRKVNLNGIFENNTMLGSIWYYDETEWTLKASEMRIRPI